MSTTASKVRWLSDESMFRLESTLPAGQTRPADLNPNGDAISRVGHWWIALL